MIVSGERYVPLGHFKSQQLHATGFIWFIRLTFQKPPRNLHICLPLCLDKLLLLRRGGAAPLNGPIQCEPLQSRASIQVFHFGTKETASRLQTGHAHTDAAIKRVAEASSSGLTCFNMRSISTSSGPDTSPRRSMVSTDFNTADCKSAGIAML